MPPDGGKIIHTLADKLASLPIDMAALREQGIAPSMFGARSVKLAETYIFRALTGRLCMSGDKMQYDWDNSSLPLPRLLQQITSRTLPTPKRH